MTKIAQVKLLYSSNTKSVYLKIKLGSGSQEDKAIADQFVAHKWLGFDNTTDANGQNVWNGWLQRKLSIVSVDGNESQFEDFFASGKVAKIMAQVNKKGYVFPKNTETILNAQKVAIQKQRQALSNASQVDAATKDLVSYIVDVIKNSYNDPEIEKFISSIKSIKLDDSANEIILKTKELSNLNKIKIYAQWRKEGRAGMPTDVATSTQWLAVGRYVTDKGLPLVVTRTSDSGVGMNRAKFGVSKNQVSGINARMAYVRSDKFTGGNGNYFNYVVYDVSDTKPLGPDFYSTDDNMENLTGKFTSSKSHNDLNSAESQTNDLDQAIANQNAKEGNVSNDEATAKQQLLNSIGDNPKYEDVKDMLYRKPFRDAVQRYFSHSDIVDRERDQKIKDAKLKLLTGAALIRLNIDKPYGVSLIDSMRQDEKQLMNSIGDVLGTLNDFLSIFSDPTIGESRQYMKEGIEVSMDWLLNLLGIDSDEYNMQMEDIRRSQRLMKESFDIIWNKMIKANDRNHAVI